jgi:capsule biosynthesis protein capA
MEKIAFLGDFVLTNIINNKNSYFLDFIKFIEDKKIKTIINLESPAIETNMKRIKEKITLHCSKEDLAYLKCFNPYLINLSNNHINDYGNDSVELTIRTLKDNNLAYWGVGYDQEKEKKIFFKDEQTKIIYLSYCSRTSDLTGSRLFAEKEFIGGWQEDINEIAYFRKENSNYFIIVNIHWGIENIKYPETEKCLLARKIIDAGADLIIGHHPHIIQPFEIYKGKYIFYSIGNFYFPSIIEFELQGKTQLLETLPHQKKGIVPIIAVADEKLIIEQILLVENLECNQKITKNFKLQKIVTNTLIYNIKTKSYYYIGKICDFIRYKLKIIITNPKYFFQKLFQKLFLWKRN